MQHTEEEIQAAKDYALTPHRDEHIFGERFDAFLAGITYAKQKKRPRIKTPPVHVVSSKQFDDSSNEEFQPNRNRIMHEFKPPFF